MAYNGDYNNQQRPYAGPAAGRPAPRPYGAAYRPQQQPPPQQQHQQFDQHNDGYGQGGYNNSREQYDDGYRNDYGAPPQQNGNNFARRPVPPPQNQGYQDHNSRGPGPAGPGRGGFPPGRGGRGGPMMRGGMQPRGGGPGPGPGRGQPPPGRGGFRPQPPERAATADPYADRRGQHPMGGHQDHDLSGRMASLDLGGRRPTITSGPAPNRGPGPMQPQDDYRRPSLDGHYPARAAPGRGYHEPNPGPAPQNQGYGYQDQGFEAPAAPMHQPARSMTMPAHHEPPDMGRQTFPPRLDSAPAASQSLSLAPQHHHQGGHSQRSPPQPSPSFSDPQGGFLSPGPPPSSFRGSFGDIYDEYYNDARESYASAQHRSLDFETNGGYGAQDDIGQHIRPGPGRGTPQQVVAGRVPEMSRTKSQPNLRESQTAVFEMAADLPPMPPPSNFQAYNPSVNDHAASGYGLPANPGPPRAATMNGPHGGPVLGHPAPVRPGLMANSMVNMNDKPIPVRNYQNVGAPSQAPYPTEQPIQQHMQPISLPRPVSGSAEKIPVTNEELDRLRENIKYMPDDQQTALTLAKKLIEAADTLTPRIPDPKARMRARERYILDSEKILKRLVQQQNPEAMFFMADCNGKGTFGHEPDNKEAFTLYQSAAKLGHPAAAYRTAVCCEIGNDDGGGTRKDPLKAIQWYQRAATLGDTPAMYKVGMILLKGLLGQQRNPRESIAWLKKAADRADRENPHALHELGMLYEMAQPGDVIMRDDVYALQLFEQAAQLGYKFSQYKLGCAYEYGLLGCPIDPRASISWYSQAAQQSEHQSELALSGWYLTGSDGILNQNDTEAYLWARKAAQAGLAKAEYAMGYFTEVGIGVPANLEDAKRWYWRAAAQNFPKARERLEDLKRSGGHVRRQRERISRSNMSKQQTDGECSVM